MSSIAMTSQPGQDVSHRKSAGVFDPSADEDEGGKMEDEEAPDLGALLQYAKRQLELVRAELDRRNDLRRQDAAQSRVEALLRRVESGSRPWAAKGEDRDESDSTSTAGSPASDDDRSSGPPDEAARADDPKLQPDWLRSDGSAADSHGCGGPVSPVGQLLPRAGGGSGPVRGPPPALSAGGKGERVRARASSSGRAGSKRRRSGTTAGSGGGADDGLMGGGVAVVMAPQSAGTWGGAGAGAAGAGSDLGLVDPILETMERSLQQAKAGRKARARAGTSAGAMAAAAAGNGKAKGKGKKGAGGSTAARRSKARGSRGGSRGNSSTSGVSDADADESSRPGRKQGTSRLGKLIRSKKKRETGFDGGVVLESGGAIRVRNWGDAAAKRRKARKAKEKEEAARRAKLERKSSRPGDRERPWRTAQSKGAAVASKRKTPKGRSGSYTDAKRRDSKVQDQGGLPAKGFRPGCQYSGADEGEVDAPTGMETKPRPASRAASKSVEHATPPRPARADQATYENRSQIEEAQKRGAGQSPTTEPSRPALDTSHGPTAANVAGGSSRKVDSPALMEAMPPIDAAQQSYEGSSAKDSQASRGSMAQSLDKARGAREVARSASYESTERDRGTGPAAGDTLTLTLPDGNTTIRPPLPPVGGSSSAPPSACHPTATSSPRREYQQVAAGPAASLDYSTTGTINTATDAPLDAAHLPSSEAAYSGAYLTQPAENNAGVPYARVYNEIGVSRPSVGVSSLGQTTEDCGAEESAVSTVVVQAGDAAARNTGSTTCITANSAIESQQRSIEAYYPKTNSCAAAGQSEPLVGTTRQQMPAGGGSSSPGSPGLASDQERQAVTGFKGKSMPAAGNVPVTRPMSRGADQASPVSSADESGPPVQPALPNLPVDAVGSIDGTSIGQEEQGAKVACISSSSSSSVPVVSSPRSPRVDVYAGRIIPSSSTDASRAAAHESTQPTISSSAPVEVEGRASRGLALVASLGTMEPDTGELVQSDIGDRDSTICGDGTQGKLSREDRTKEQEHVGSLVGVQPDPRRSDGASAARQRSPPPPSEEQLRVRAMDPAPMYPHPIGPQVPSYSGIYPEFSAIFTGCMEGLSAIGQAVRGGHSGQKRGKRIRAQRADAVQAATCFLSILQAVKAHDVEAAPFQAPRGSLQGRLTREAYVSLIAPVQAGTGESDSGNAGGSADTTDSDDADECPPSPSPSTRGSSDHEVDSVPGADDIWWSKAGQRLTAPDSGHVLSRGDAEISAGIAALRRRAGKPEAKPAHAATGMMASHAKHPPKQPAVLPPSAASHKAGRGRSSRDIIRAQGDLRSSLAKLRALYTLATDDEALQGRPASAPSQSAGNEGSGFALPDPPKASSLEHFTRVFRVIRNRNEVYSLVCNALATWERPPSKRRVQLQEDAAAEGNQSSMWPTLTGGGLWREMHWALDVTPGWHLLWSWGKPPVQRSKLVVWQKVNHFKHARELCRKDLLKKNLGRYQCLGGRMARAFTIMPPTFVLPKEYLAFAEAFGKETYGAMSGDSVAAYATTNQSTARTVAAAAAAALSAGKGVARVGAASAAGAQAYGGAGPNWWILKPVGMSRGRGIELVTSIEDVRYGQDCVLQRYIRNPCLLDGYKFDLRLYVLVTSFSPVEAFLYTKGFARLSSRKYSTNTEGASDKAIHLTNSSIYKHVQAGAASTVHSAGQEHAGGTKISLQYLWQRLAADGKDVQAAWSNIVDVIVKSLVCLDDVVPHQPNSFEVFGYDVLLDENLRAWLIEVNSSPSMGIDSMLDARTKLSLIRDTVALVDPLPFSHEALAEVTERRIHMHAEAARRPHQVSIGSGLGSGSGASVTGEDRRQLDLDLFRVLRGRRPRAYGEMPASLGAYERICPGSEPFRRVMKLKFSYFASGTRAGKARLTKMAKALGAAGLRRKGT